MRNKLITKKIFLILFLGCVVLFGCKPVNKSIDENQEWKLDVQYNRPQNDFGQDYISHLTENGIIAYVDVATKDNKYYYPLYIQDKNVYSMLDKVSSTCSFSNVENCESLLDYTVQGPMYYKGKVYSFKESLDATGNEYKLEIISSDLDGSNQKIAYKVIQKQITNGESGKIYMQIHKNKIYVNYFGDLFIGDIDSSELNKIEIPGVEDLWKIFLIDDKMYMTTEEYDDGEKIHYHAILQSSLDGTDVTMLYDNMLAVFVDEKNVFFRDENTYEWFILNRETNKSKKIDDIIYYYILKYEDTYLLDTKYYYSDKFTMTILDENGDVIHTKDYTNDEYCNTGPLYLGDRYYVHTVGLDDTPGWFGYYEITEDGISDIIMLDKLDE